MSNRSLTANVSTGHRRWAGATDARERSFSFVEIKKSFASEPFVLGRHAVRHRRLKEIIFEYQSVAVMIQFDSQNSGIRKSAAVNLAAFTGVLVRAPRFAAFAI
jgi:hypothetical protein